MSRRFQRRVEDFACGNCGAGVTGDGYTNHCPKCLWSRHVDVNPGDRAAECDGAMAPVAVELRAGAWTLTHRCRTCGAERRCKSAAADDREAILAVARAAAEHGVR
jgi:hypothetical protein